MINAVVKQRKDEKFDIWMYDGSNGNLLVSSDQGYERAIDAENIARRLAPAGEPMHLAVRYLDGTSKTETIDPVARDWRAWFGSLLARQAVEVGNLTAGVAAIAVERAHQITKGYTAEHDAEHGPEEIINAALAYAVQAQDRISVAAVRIYPGAARPEAHWPWGRDSFHADDNELQSLAKAGALLAAAYDAATGGAR